jgi:predicted phosphodiesterase
MRKIFVSLLLILSWSLCSQEPLKIAVISDTHYLSSKLALPGSALDKYEATTGRVINDLHAVLHKVIFDLQSYNPDILLIPGDITNHGERESHIDFVNIMKPLANNGTRIFVIPGNHDVNVPNSKKYEGDSSYPISSISAQEFAQLYAPYGYGDAVKRDASSLSYLAVINDSTWLLSIDSNRYEEYKTSSISGGRILPETMKWSLEILKEAASKDVLVMGMMHHGLVEHMPYQSVFFSDYLINDWKSNAQILADNGLKIIFTGHFHSNDITLLTSSKGNTIHDIETGSLSGYPFPYRLMTLQNKVLSIESKFVETIPGKPNLKGEYRQKTEEIARRSAQAKINSMSLLIPLDMKSAVIDLLVKMQILHMGGDEKVDDEMLQLIKRINKLVGDPNADFSSFDLDFPPADNTIEIVL